MLQVQHYLAVTGHEWATLAIFNADAWELMLIPVERWDETTMQVLIDVERSFWETNIVPQIPPDLQGEKRIELPEYEGTLKSLNDNAEFREAVRSYMSASEYAKEADELKAAARDAVLAAIKQEPGVFENDEYRVYNTTVAGRKTFDKKALARAKPIDRLQLGALMLLDNTYTPSEIESLFDRTTLDLSDFEKQGNDFTTMRVYPVKLDE